jgi:hypothetical protein
MDKEVAYRKMLKCTNKDKIKNVGRCSDTFKCKWSYKIKEF